MNAVTNKLPDLLGLGAGSRPDVNPPSTFDCRIQKGRGGAANKVASSIEPNLQRYAPRVGSRTDQSPLVKVILDKRLKVARQHLCQRAPSSEEQKLGAP